MLVVGGEGKVGEALLECVTPGMPQALMPEHDGRSSSQVSLRRGGCQRVEFAAAITSEELRAGGKILNGKTKRIKFNTDVVVTG
jgi:hypothetical protein